MKLEAIKVTSLIKDKYYKRINLDGAWKLKDMRADPLKFAKFMIGMTPRDYQMVLFDNIEKYDKLAVVKARQIGFTTSIALYCLWAVWFNKFPCGVDDKTRIVLISKDDDAAKDVLQRIKDFMYMGDQKMANFLRDKTVMEKDGTKRKIRNNQLFTSEIKINNSDQLKLNNGCIAYSFPPTGKVRGRSPSVIFIDEFAFLNSADKRKFLNTDVLPALSETQGKLILSSTPNGYGDLFYEIIDPDDKVPNNIYKRLMFNKDVYKNSDYQAQIELIKEGLDESEYKQEYECDFTQNTISFFQSRKIREMFDDSVLDLLPDKYEYSAGIDYGMTEARTVITLCTEIEGIIYRIYYKEFDSGWDSNGVIPFMEGLRDRFRINKIVVDKCPQGDAINKKMIEKGWHIEEFDFHTQKEESYCAFRNRLNKNEFKTAHDRATEKQMLEMEQEESKMGKLMIHKPRSGRDDIVDSLIMAAKPFLATKKQLRVFLA